MRDKIILVPFAVEFCNGNERGSIRGVKWCRILWNSLKYLNCCVLMYLDKYFEKFTV